MHYFGMNYCPRKYTGSWKYWAFWITSSACPTFFSDIKQDFFVRILGVEFKRLWWEPKHKCTYQAIVPVNR